jgi:hypothetical protein
MQAKIATIIAMEETFTPHAQTVFKGYGIELVDSLSRFHNLLESGPKGKLEADELIETHYKEWFSNCPHVEHICFADITFFSADHISVKDALTIVFSPTADDTGRYKKAVANEYIKGGDISNGHTMAPHAVFRDGLPFLNGFESTGPTTKAELETFYREVETSKKQAEVVDGYFYHCIETTEVEASYPRLGEWDKSNFDASSMDPYEEKNGFTDELETVVSDYSVREQFRAWVDLWTAKAKSGLQLNALGQPIRHLLCVPVGFRNPDYPRDFTQIACLFLGIGDITVNCVGSVSEILRYFILHISDCNSGAMSLRLGEHIGQDSAIVPASHELSRLIPAITSRSPEPALRLLRSYFGMLLLDSENVEVNPEIIDTESLLELVEQGISWAVKIDKLTKLQTASTGGIQVMSDAAFEEEMEREVSKIIAKCDLTELEGLTLNREWRVKHRLFLALTAAFRNVLRHGTGSEKNRLCIRCQIEQRRGSILTIENAFNTWRTPYTSAGKPRGGTLKALRGYVRSYGKDPRKVRLQRVGVADSLDEELPYRLTWQTIMPLPFN